MKVVSIPVAQLLNDPANVRKHNPRNLGAIKASLAKFGQQKPIVVGENNVVIAGNGTLEAASALGWDKIDCVRSGLKGSEATGFAIADNRTAELAEWSDELGETLKALELGGMDLDDLGFTGEELDALLGELSTESGGEESGENQSVPEKFELIVECGSESQQQELYERFQSEGLACRVLTL